MVVLVALLTCCLAQEVTLPITLTFIGRAGIPISLLQVSQLVGGWVQKGREGGREGQPKKPLVMHTGGQAKDIVEVVFEKLT